MVRITNKATVDAAGSEEYVTATTVSAPVGSVMVLTVTPLLVNEYLTANSRVMSVYRPSGNEVKATITNLAVSTVGSGDYTLASLLPNAIGGIEQTWTLTFTNTTAFNIAGDTVGAVGSGNLSAGAAPNNTSFSEPYFVMQPAGFTGSFTAADTIVFNTHPAAVPIWMKRVVPANCPVASDNRATLVFDGDSAT